MKYLKTRRFIGLCLLLTTLGAGVAAGQDKLLWQIGKADNDTGEFALARDRSNQYLVTFPHGVLFVAGRSATRQDWPYIQPGPADVWAGSKSHTFSILFGLKSSPARGNCRLVLDFVDTHSARPPKLQIRINDASFVRELPRGAGDASAFGQVEKGREHILTVEFPAAALKPGNNDIHITTLEGSWILYDQVTLTAPAGVESGPPEPADRLLDVHSQPFLVRRGDGRLYQPVMASVLRIGDAARAEVLVDGAEPVRQRLAPGFKVLEGFVPAVEDSTSVEVQVNVAGKSIGKRKLQVNPVRKWQVYLLHHSHVDIGYTHVQTEVEQRHWGYFEQVIELARKTAAYPEGSRFKWNTEVLWAVDSYLKQASEEKRREFCQAVRNGWIGLDALYGNELTALCRPEELVRLVDFAGRLRRQHGFDINSAMITDVPGYTWGIVPVLAGGGVKYFSVGPNRGHRIGYTLSAWGDKPFYWQGPSGKERILCWVAGEGYSLFHSGRLDAGRLFKYLKQLDDSKYPYDMLQVRYSIGGDNGPPDPDLADFVRGWNAKYAYPRLIVATTAEMFRDFEQRYGAALPEQRGDFTPYWEDGAGSSARETSLNRDAAERLVQAEALWAMLDPAGYPADDFYAAWRNVILYDEHTWGAHCSISQPDSDFTKAQWKIKQAFALDADRESRKLLDDSVAGRRAAGNVKAVDVFNTSSWPRTDLVILPKEWKTDGDRVEDASGRTVPSQRLLTGELAFLAEDVPPLGAARFFVDTGPAGAGGMTERARVEGRRLYGNSIVVSIDERSGAIAGLKRRGIPVDLADGDNGLGLNDYLYVAGRDPKSPQRIGKVKIGAGEAGPLVASLVIESDAPGCRRLRREVRVVAGIDRVDIINVMDKENIYAKEAVHVAFPFNVPGGVMRMHVPWGVIRPEADQLVGACKNYFTVQRWVDVSNDDFGVTWASVDAPLVEVGRITADPVAVGWIRKMQPSTTLYSYVMNNYWETNYKAGQEGPTTFRYSIMAHNGFDGGRAARFGAECSQPLIAVPVTQSAGAHKSLFSVEPAQVVVTAFKPSEDRKAYIVRLFNATGIGQRVRLKWGRPLPQGIWLSNFAEEQTGKIDTPIEMGGYEIKTLRIPLNVK